jgi:hypothetical protein
MTVPAMRLDFVRNGRRRRMGARVLLAVGVVSVAVTLLAYQQLRARTDGLELRLEAHAESLRPTRRSGETDGPLFAEAAAAVAELSTPWSRLLDELEAAAQDSSESVALLAVEPDRGARKVKIMAEARNLPDAIAFAQRLQQSDVLLHPLLDNHEVQAQDRSRPVRFEITAAWRNGA